MVEFDDSPGIELRAADDGKTYVRGYFAPFGKYSHVLYGMFREKIHPDAFDGVLESKTDTVALFNHDSDNVLARRRSKRLKLDKDERGAFYEFALPDTTLGRDLKVLIENGDIRGSSFAFTLPPDGSGSEWAKGEDGMEERTIMKVSDLIDVGPVTFPAYPDSTTGVLSKRSIEELENRQTPEPEPEPEPAPEPEPEINNDEIDLRIRIAKMK